MRKVYGIILILFAIYVGRQGTQWLQGFRAHHGEKQQENAGNPGDPGTLAGMPSQLEPLYQAALKQGPKTLKKWLDYYGPQIEDPRKAWIQLDYVVDVSTSDMAEAKRVFAEVKARVPKNSPVYSRVQRLEKAYE